MSISRIFLLLSVVVFSIVGCDTGSHSPASDVGASEISSPIAKTSEIQDLLPVDVPPSVFVANNDAVAFYADDAYAVWAEIDVSSLRENHDVTSIRVYAVNADGWSREVSVTTDGEGQGARFFIQPTADTRYLAYADLGEDVQRTYQALCSISEVRLGLDNVGEDVPEICTQILCGRDAYAPDRLFTEHEEMTVHRERMYEIGYPTESYGGLGLGRDVCDQCIRNDAGPSLFYPTERCAADKFIPPVWWRDREAVIEWSPVYPESVFFVREYYASSLKRQIFRTTASSPTQVSQTPGPNWGPDVSHAERKVIWTNPRFSSTQLLVDRFTDPETQVPGPSTGPTWKFHARWNNLEAYKEQIVFPRPTAPGSPSETELWVINEDGTGLRQLTDRPERIAFGDTTGFDVWNGTTLLFTNRLDGQAGIYAKSMTDSPSIQGTQIDVCDGLGIAPVVSHDQTMVAYLCHNNSVTGRTVRIVEAGNWNNILYEFPVQRSVHGFMFLDFSGDDQHVYLEQGPYHSMSIYRFNLDGTNPLRVTPPTHIDTNPSVMPSYAVEE